MARICHSCGRANDDDASFCQGCGTPLSAVQPSHPSAPRGRAVTPAAPGSDRRPPGGQPRAWVAVVIVAVVLAAAATVAAVLFVRSGGRHPAETQAPVMEPTVAVSPTSDVVGYLAAATGPRADRLSAIDADGTVKPLSRFSGGQVWHIAYSPDGAWLACVAGTEKHSELWLFEASNGAGRQATANTPAVVAVDSIAWLSPTEMLMAGYTEVPKWTGQNAEFLVYDLEHESVTPLTDDGGTPLTGVSVSASRDGGTVAFVTYEDVKTDAADMTSATEHLRLLDRSTGVVTDLGESEAFFEINARAFDAPLLSPAGDALIYRRAGSDISTSYTVVGTDGTVLMDAKETQFPAGYAWDPDGTQVVFSGHVLKSSGDGSGVGPAVFWVFDTVTRSTQVLARYKDTMVQEISWSPDGKAIAWAAYDQDRHRTGTIYLMPTAGGDSQTLAKAALSPAWSPRAVPSLGTSSAP